MTPLLPIRSASTGTPNLVTVLNTERIMKVEAARLLPNPRSSIMEGRKARMIA